MDNLKRYATLLLAATIGIGAAVGYCFLSWPDAKAPESERDTVFKEACVVFFGMLYLSGWSFARLLRSKALSDEIRGMGAWHMKLLILASALMGIQRWWSSRGRGFGRLDDLVAVGFMLAFAGIAIVFEVQRHRREA